MWILDEGLPHAADLVRREVTSQGAQVQAHPEGAGIVVWLHPGAPPPSGIPRRAANVGVWVITEHRTVADWQAHEVDIVHVWPDDADRVQRGVRAMLRRLGVAERLGYAWDLFDLAPTFNGVIALTPTGPTLRVANRALAALIDQHPPHVVQGEVDAYQPLFDEAVAAGAPVERLRDRASALVGPIRELVRCVPTAPSRDGDPQVALLINNLTDQMRAEQRLTASEARLKDVVDLAADALLGVRADGRVRLVNRATCRLFDRAEDTLVGVAAGDLLPELGASDTSPRRTFALRGGERVPVRLTIGEAGEDGSRTLVIHDLAEEERIAERMSRADRLASLGALAAGVGHEINNPLGFVLANLEFARRSAVGEARIALDEALDGVSRIRSIVDDLRNFAQTPDPAVGAVALDVVVGRTLRLLNNEIRHRAQLVTRLDPVPRVVGQPDRLGQVVTNLVTNAVRAIPADRTGKISVEVRAGEGDVVLEVTDDGVGIAPEDLPRIFDPFFAVRSDGDGLGLAILPGVVSAFGGRIDVESQRGLGTRFTVHLPVFVAVAPVAPPAAARRPSDAGRRLLVVDDEPMIGRAIARMLGDTWKVGVYRSTADAMSALAAGERFDVCLCDLMMPGDGGAVFSAAVVDRQPELARKTGFVTGGAFTDDARAFAGSVSDRVLAKPFDRATLERFLAMLAAR